MSERKNNKESDVEHEAPMPDISTEIPKYQCGWFNFRPKCLQRFMSPKWALFWLCWAGAVQGKCGFCVKF